MQDLLVQGTSLSHRDDPWDGGVTSFAQAFSLPLRGEACSLNTLTEISLGFLLSAQSPQRLARQCLGQTPFLSSVSHLAPSTVAPENTRIGSGHPAPSSFYLSQISRNFTKENRKSTKY